MIDKNTIYSYFQTDDFPTEEQFRATWDSFWHKSESIPMNSIAGLNEMFQQTVTNTQLSQKANKDGSNIDVLAFQEKLKIAELITTAKQEVKTEILNGAPEAYDTLKEISDWISDDETAESAILQAIQNEATERINSDNLKLDTPASPYNTNQYVIMGDGSTKPAGDLGKNFFNTDLNNTAARSHTMNAAVSVDTLGNPHYLKSLPNKNTDITNFRKVRVQNTSGLDAVVDSKNLLIDIPSQLSDAEKTTWKTQMNGGWTTATMSVSSILPPFIDQNKDYNTYITLNGANLNLNPASFTVQLLDLSNNVIVTIPNSQVQLNTVGTSLTFYYNFHSIPLGNYKVRLWNGVAFYTTPISISIVATINNVDLSSAVWQKQELEAGKLTTSNNSLTGTLQSNITTILTPALSGLLNIPDLTLNDDFIISCTFLGLGGNPSNNIVNTSFGLSTSSNITGIVNAVSYGVNVRQYQTKASAAVVGGFGQTAPITTIQNTSFAFDLIMSKSGNILNICILNPNTGSPVISTVTITPSTQPISLAFFSESNGNIGYTTSFNTVNILKIN